ncbi:sensor histidine kinase [Actinoallomurus sp. CA-142502]|uniref:sensor histidine kinase n=1 Tax=Actinoallomurus sp. CA-142502 TaxID=3239885 RepID=UPI003D95033D
MGRHLLAAAVVAADTALLATGYGNVLHLWGVLACALGLALVIALSHRMPVAAFTIALGFVVSAGGGYVLLLWTAYQAGRRVVSRAGTAAVVGAALGGLAGRLLVRPPEPRSIPAFVCAYVVFVALPLLVGRYLAQHERLLSALDRNNRRLRRERELLAERERLRERLRIARDMHDSLGHRLSLVTIQASALEVSVPPAQREAVRRLGAAASDAVDELHALLGTLRGEEGRSQGAAAIEEVVAEFRSAGLPVTSRRLGEPRAVDAEAGQAAYRVVQEGLTNASRHAPGRPVTVSLAWEPDGLLVTVVNPVAGQVADGAGHGLTGLDERVRAAGGFLDHRTENGEFRLVAMLPLAAETEGAETPVPGAARTALLGFATAALMFVVLPMSMLVGVA